MATTPATVPDNSTVFLDAYDSVLNFSDTLLYQVSYTGIPDSNSTWCLSRYPEAAAASPGVALPPLQSATSGANQTITPTQYVDTSGTIAGLWISVGVVSLAFLILLFLHIRLKRRFTRAKRGQATIGKWSKRHFDDDAKELDTDKPWESFTISKPKATTLSLLPSRKNRSLHTFSGESFFNSQSARTSRLSSFFENRSASRTGQTTTNGNHTTRRPSEGSSAINPFEEGDYSEILSTSGRSDTTYDNNTSSKRHSTAETTISQANTVQSGTESHFSSSAHSEQASTIGGSSAISDEYYHRKKATTISPLSSKPTGKPFLDPGMASSSPRQ